MYQFGIVTNVMIMLLVVTENEEHFLLRCLHPTSKYIEKTLCLRLAQSSVYVLFYMYLLFNYE